MKRPTRTVMGLHAPPPRPTVLAAFVVAVGQSTLFLTLLWVWRHVV